MSDDATEAELRDGIDYFKRLWRHEVDLRLKAEDEWNDAAEDRDRLRAVVDAVVDHFSDIDDLAGQGLKLDVDALLRLRRAAESALDVSGITGGRPPIAPEDVPQELIAMIDAAAGKEHGRQGSVVRNLAEILTRFRDIESSARGADAERWERARAERSPRSFVGGSGRGESPTGGGREGAPAVPHAGAPVEAHARRTASDAIVGDHLPPHHVAAGETIEGHLRRTSGDGDDVEADVRTDRSHCPACHAEILVWAWRDEMGAAVEPVKRPQLTLVSDDESPAGGATDE